MSDPGFWSDQNNAKTKSKLASDLKHEVDTWYKFELEMSEIEELVHLAQKENDKALERDLKAKFEDLRVLFEQFRLTTFLSDKYDNHDAILSIHAGTITMTLFCLSTPAPEVSMLRIGRRCYYECICDMLNPRNSKQS
ncbi:MAG: PCRF domain-containing protein [Candidatus Doudnabacteria bacterium]|nr:PCRF domain-containing protein [Candidatus Doudnabacteria bacterium]